MIIDSHCHLDYEPMFSNLNEVIKKAKDSKKGFELLKYLAIIFYHISFLKS